MLKPLGVLREFYREGVIDPEFATFGPSQVTSDITIGRAGLIFGARWSPLLPLYKTVEADPRIDWVGVPVPRSGGGIAAAPEDLSPNDFHAVKKGTAHPEVLLRMANLAWRLINGPDAEITYHTDTGSGFETFWHACVWLKMSLYSWNYDTLATMIAARSDPSSLTGTKRLYYDRCVAYLDGDRSGWPYWKIYGPGGTNAVYAAFDAETRNGSVKKNAFFGRTLPARVEKGSTLDKLRDEMLPTVVMGEKPLSYFHEFVKNWYELGGQEQTDQVNAWYKARQKRSNDPYVRAENSP
jgi:putative aldouronate transport system substrate-binding protein